MKFILNPGELQLIDLRILMDESTTLALSTTKQAHIHAAEDMIKKILHTNKAVYGVNTGFGALAHTRINAHHLETLQRSLLLSHASGTGELLSDAIVRLILALKINSLARGFSGVRLQTIEALIKLYNSKLYPCIPCQGSVGASGDLAPLAHLSTVLIGEGEVRFKGKVISAKQALAKINLKPLKLAPKEGLALINGTQVSTGIALFNLFATQTIFNAALLTGALSVDAARGSDVPFDPRIHEIRGHVAQIKVAQILRRLLQGSEIRQSHLACEKVQDPYSLRCQPQVMGACLAQLNYASEILLTEANGVTDNPLVFAEDDEILTGGNFHAEPVAFAADALAISIAEIGAISERRIALLIDPHFSNLPAFLVKEAGLNSGFMTAQVTAAALTSENKSLAHPAGVDSLPTSANQEDHVSMATYAARRLLNMTDNTATIVAIELLAACQGIDFLRPLRSSNILEEVHQIIRQAVPFYAQDRYFATDIAAATTIVKSDKLNKLLDF